MSLTLPQKTKILSVLTPFSLLEPTALHVLAFSAREQVVAAGQKLFSIGDLSDGGMVIIEGGVTLLAGNQATTMGPGTLIGAAALISETKRPATAMAEGQTRLLVVPRLLMQQVLEAHPQSALRLRDQIAGAVAETRQALARLAL